MPRVCPRPCGRLTTAAVFIAVGVVQLLVGIILLRSKFADLLSGPDFMTASSNIGIGCVYGLAASVWKSKKKHRSMIQTAKNNVLASLLISIITINTTTTLILIMGDGNKLLFAYMEAVDRKSSAAFANEVLAGAYVTSVCSPIVCIVVAIVALSGSCFQGYVNKHKNLEKASDIESPFGWVSDLKAHSRRPKLVGDCLAETPTTSSDQSSRFSEDSVFPEKDTQASLQRKSNKYIQSPISTWEHKRKHMLRNSRLKKRSQIFNTLLPQPELIPRIKESSILKKHKSSTGYTLPCCDSIKLTKEKHSNQSSSVETGLKKTDSKCSYDACSGKVNNHSSEVRLAKKSPGSSDRSGSSATNEDKSDANCSRNNSFEYFISQKSIPSDVDSLRNKPAPCKVDDLALRHAELHLLEKINPTLLKLKVETLRELKARMQSIPSVVTSEVTLEKQSSGILKQSEGVVGTSSRNTVPDSLFSEETRVEVLGNTENEVMRQVGEKHSNESVYIIKEDSSEKLSSKSLLSPNTSMSPSDDTIKKNKAQYLHNSILNGIKSKTFDFSPRKCQSADRSQNSDVGNSSSLVCNDGEKKITNLVLDCPKVPAIKLQSRKRDVTKRMASMKSITEIPSEEAMDDSESDQNFNGQRKSSTSKGLELLNRDENSNLMPEDTGTSKDISSDAIKRRKLSTNPSIKNMLKGIWSSSGPEAKFNILELIMDEDSLIGLSEEDLINRTHQLRALRKAVAERLKDELEKETRMEEAVDPVCNALSE